jgi:hypothetical protein
MNLILLSNELHALSFDPTDCKNPTNDGNDDDGFNFAACFDAGSTTSNARISALKKYLKSLLPATTSPLANTFAKNRSICSRFFSQ